MSIIRPDTPRDGYSGPWSMLRSIYGLSPDSDVSWELWCNTCGAHFDVTDEEHLVAHAAIHSTQNSQ